jgi:hypothetical protein
MSVVTPGKQRRMGAGRDKKGLKLWQLFYLEERGRPEE